MHKLTSDQANKLQEEAVRAIGIVGSDSSTLLKYLVTRLRIGETRTPRITVREEALVVAETQFLAILQKYGMQAGVDYMTAVSTLVTASDGKTGEGAIEMLKDSQILMALYFGLTRLGCAFDETMGQEQIADTVSEPVYGEAIISFPIDAEDIEAALKS